MQRFNPAEAVVAVTQPAFYRVTALGKDPAVLESLVSRSTHLLDLLRICERGMWDRELRQFMPPASLREAMELLLSLGLIECVRPVDGNGLRPR